MMRPARPIAHIDLDSFYASAEVVRDRSLEGRPVIVGADPKGGQGRGVVVSCNYPARKFGVRSAMPISQAWRLCPDAVYIRPDFAYYDLVSSRVMEIIRGRATKFEQVSIDEAFVDLSDRVVSIEGTRLWIDDLKVEIRSKTGLTCSVGFAENKTTAKIATDLNKPDGVTIVQPGETRMFLAELPTSSIPGVGVKTELILAELGMKKIGDLQAADDQAVKRRLGKTGAWLKSVALGLENEEVRERGVKSLSTERTFESDTDDWDDVARVMSEMGTELIGRVAAAHLVFKRVGVKVRFQGFETHTKESTVLSFTADKSILDRETTLLMEAFRKSTKKRVRLVGLRVSDLRNETPSQTSIMAWMDQKETKIEARDMGDGSAASFGPV